MKLVPYKAAWVCDAGYSDAGHPLSSSFSCREIYQSKGEYYIFQDGDYIVCPTFIQHYDPRCSSSSAQKAYEDWGMGDLCFYSPAEIEELCKMTA